ncbi:MAG: hypothetical protein K8I82_29500 [Anaerolineae bacterium]|nr:hypothetical protein [Anaerolineae bacterium]
MNTADQLLNDATRVIRSTRTEAYLTRADAFVSSWRHFLGFERGAEKRFGTNWTGVDILFEKTHSASEIHRISYETELLTDLSNARNYLKRMSERHSVPDVEEAVKTVTAYVTVCGYEAFEKDDERFAQLWLIGWQNEIAQHNKAQGEYSVICLNPNHHFAPLKRSDLQSLTESYVNKFHPTVALPVIIYSLLPFSTGITLDYYQDLQVLLPGLSKLFRLSQDVNIDTTEILNLGIYLTANTQNLSLGQARKWLQQGGNRLTMEGQIRKVWQAHYDRIATDIDALFIQMPKTSELNNLRGMSQMLLAIAQRLTTDRFN